MNNTAELEIKTSVQLVLIEAANLSIEDEFLKYEPQTEEEKFLKEELTNVISNGIKNFWTTIYNPYYSENMKKIYFVDNEKATTGRSFEWWKKNARTISRYNKSRLGKMSEYIALLGVLIKELIKSGWTVEEAWYFACFEPQKITAYLNTKKEKEYQEKTDNDEVFKLCNIDSCKLVADDKNGYWIVASKCDSNMITRIRKETDSKKEIDECTGWIVFGR